MTHFDLGLAEPTPGPCPPWCTAPAGHVFDSLDPEDGRLYRNHQTSLFPHHRVGVTVLQEETCAGDGTDVRRGVTAVHLDGDSVLKPAEARGVASALRRGARLVERIGAGR